MRLSWPTDTVGDSGNADQDKQASRLGTRLASHRRGGQSGFATREGGALLNRSACSATCKRTHPDARLIRLQVTSPWHIDVNIASYFASTDVA